MSWSLQKFTLFNFILIINLSASGKLKEILMSTNDYIVDRKFIYEHWSRNFNHMYNMKKMILSQYALNAETH